MSEKSVNYFESDQTRLPHSEDVSIGTLSGLFANTTNSYKYILFLSILDILKRRNFDVSESITFKDLVVEILSNAWYPHTYFKLSFGKQDQITKNLDSLILEIGEPILKFTDTDKTLLRATIAAQDLEKATQRLVRYVPFRLIVPFFNKEMRPVKDKGNTRDSAIPRAAEAYFDEKKPLYRFDSDQYSSCGAIVIHPSWAAYLQEHYAIVRGWASWEWLRYMQKRNPNAPGLIYKLFAPTKRSSLTKQTSYWKTVLREANLNCIYSNQKLDIETLSLDHYLPWSFLAHDQLWNLIPTLPDINSSKSNSLPPPDSFDRFVNLQHSALDAYFRGSNRSYDGLIKDDYAEGLRIYDIEDLRNLRKLKSAYEEVVQSQLRLATNQGFSIWQSPYSAA
ncbi:MAG: HNH endonuclease domain-containing protein [Elainellaceae cyanobacterium]